MSLATQAAADLRAIIEDAAAGFGRAITITSPAGVTAALTGLSTDIAQVIDPETGVAVSGRLASVALSIETLTALGFSDLPRAVADKSSKPWIVRFNDFAGNAHTFKVREANPDRAIGCVTCTLELYKT